jgi:hypothetical protein
MGPLPMDNGIDAIGGGANGPGNENPEKEIENKKKEIKNKKERFNTEKKEMNSEKKR